MHKGVGALHNISQGECRFKKAPNILQDEETQQYHKLPVAGINQAHRAPLPAAPGRRHLHNLRKPGNLRGF